MAHEERLTDTPRLQGSHRPFTRVPLATSAEVAGEPPPFPSMTTALPCETAFVDWRERLTRNLTRRSDGRWDPLTFVHEERR
jgi:hypothetical protein